MVFHVYVNGELRIRAGGADVANLVAAITLVCCKDPESGVLLKRLCAGTQATESTGEQAYWERLELSPGDEVTIKIIELGDADEPQLRQAPPSAGLLPDTDKPAYIREFYRSVYGDPEERPDGA